MDLSKYPVTTPYGWVAGYPLNQTDPVNHPGQGFHNGIDYGLPMNTPVIINGVEIGRSNATGSVTGPHLHIGKYQNGAAQNGGVGNGTRFNSARVFDTGYDSVNGYFVRITGDGALWNYLHLAQGSIKVSAGQVLNDPAKEPDMPVPTVQRGDVEALWHVFMPYPPKEEDYAFANGKTWEEYVKVLMGDPRTTINQDWVDRLWSQWVNKKPEQVDYDYAKGKSFSAYLDAVLRYPYTISVADLGKTGTYTEADRAAAAETNGIVKQIWQKLTSIFK